MKASTTYVVILLKMNKINKRKKEELTEVLEVFKACKNKRKALKNLFGLLSESKLHTFLEICFNLIYNVDITDTKLNNKIKLKKKINHLRKLMKPKQNEWVKMIMKTKSQPRQIKFLQSQVGEGPGIASVISAIVALVPALLNL